MGSSKVRVGGVEQKIWPMVFFLFWHFFLFVDFLGMEADGFCFKTCPVFVLGVSLGVFVPPKHMEVMLAYHWRNHSI